LQDLRVTLLTGLEDLDLEAERERDLEPERDLEAERERDLEAERERDLEAERERDLEAERDLLAFFKQADLTLISLPDGKTLVCDLRLTAQPEDLLADFLAGDLLTGALAQTDFLTTLPLGLRTDLR
jgi:hypothetical protein